MIRIIQGDCTDVLRTLEPDSVDAVVTDPPYGLEFMGKECDRLWNKGGDAFSSDKSWGRRPAGNAPRYVVNRRCNDCGKWARDKNPCRCAEPKFAEPENPKGSQHYAWQMQCWHEAWAREVYRVMKPGAYLVAFGGTRTYHRMACAIEDAGFEIRDTLCWLYGSGFPKSHDVSKGIDRAAGAEREVVGPSARHNSHSNGSENSVGFQGGVPMLTAPATPDAIRWQGWGTALKPAFEPIILARKPLLGTVVANVLQHGTGALNIDACRIEGSMDGVWGTSNATVDRSRMFNASPEMGEYRSAAHTAGRWPANVCTDGSEEVEAAFAAFGSAPGQQGDLVGHARGRPTKTCFGDMGPAVDHLKRGDSGTASRFFYSSKADKGDRADSRHPTVKPVDLMRWLVRLVTPPGGTILDPFAGSGTTGEAAMLEGFDCIMIERDVASVRDIKHRIKRWSGEDTPLFAEVAAE